jgi:type II secretory pathway component PulC
LPEPRVLFEKLFQAQQAPRVVATLLALAIVGEIALVSRQLLVFGTTVRTQSVNLASSAVVPRTSVNVDAIVSAHLFGTPLPQAGDAPESRAGLVLAGTIAMSVPGRGFAFIGESASASKLYVVGAQIPGGSTLVRVFADHIVLNRDSVLEKLSFVPPSSRLSATYATATAESAAARSMTAQSTSSASEEFPPGNKPWE